MDKANTIWIRAYTPAGHSAGITIGFEAEKLPPAADIDRMLSEAGYTVALPGMEPGEESETISHVMRRTQHNRDGTTTPCVGLYHENEKLEYCYHRYYVNSDADREEFETATGIVVDSIPHYAGDQFPKRSSPNAKAFLLALSSPVQIVVRKEAYTKDDGSTGEKAVFQRFAGQAPVTATDTSDAAWSKEQQRHFWNYYKNSQDMPEGVILSALGVTRLGAFTGTYKQAVATMRQYLIDKSDQEAKAQQQQPMAAGAENMQPSVAKSPEPDNVTNGAFMDKAKEAVEEAGGPPVKMADVWKRTKANFSDYDQFLAYCLKHGQGDNSLWTWDMKPLEIAKVIVKDKTSRFKQAAGQ